MNFRSKSGTRLPEVQFTSLIDVVFLLLCFFITTIFGLMVAIPCMLFYSYFRRRVSRMIALLEMAATEVMTLIITRPRA